MKKALHAILMIVALLLPTSAMADYCKPGENVNKSNTGKANGRQLVSFTLKNDTGHGGGDQLINVSQGLTGYIYQNVTSTTFSTSQGATVSFSTLNWAGSWMHGYLYIDYNNDQDFNTTLNRDGSGTGELVSYCYLNGKNSANETVSNETRPNVTNDVSTMPSFTIPANLPGGTYRARFIIDWDIADPCFTSARTETPASIGCCVADFLISVPVIQSTITLAAEPATAGTVAFVGQEGNPVTVDNGTAMTINATPANDNYRFTGWYNGATRVSTENPYYFTASTDVTYTAHFEQKHTVTVASTAGGSATIDGTTSVTNFNGTTVRLQATHDEDYRFTGWYDGENQVSTANPYDYTIAGDKTITAHFNAIDHSLNLTVSAGASAAVTDANGNVVAAGQRIEPGQIYTVTVAVANNHTPALRIDGTPLTLTEADGIYTATFTGGTAGPLVAVTAIDATRNDACSINGSAGQGRKVTYFDISEDRTGATSTTVYGVTTTSGSRSVYYNHYGDKTFTTKAGTALKTVSQGTGEWLQTMIYIDLNRNNQFDINTTTTQLSEVGKELVAFNLCLPGFSTTSGDATLYNMAGEAFTGDDRHKNPATTMNFTLPENMPMGYYRMRYKNDWASVDPCGSQVTGNTISGNNGTIIDFRLEIIRDVTIATSNVNHGSVKFANHEGTTIGSSVPEIIVATPAEGYRFVSWTDGEGHVVSNSAMYVAQQTSDVALTANFEKATRTIRISAEDHGSVAFGNEGITGAEHDFALDTEVTVVAIADDGYRFEGWYENNTRIEDATATYEFTVTDNRTLVAKFERDITTYPITINMSYAATYYADVYVYDKPINANGTVPEGATLYAKKEAWDDPIYYHEAPEGKELYVYVKQELQNINGNQAFVRLSSMEITNDGVSTGESLREGYGTGTSSHGKYCFTVGETAGDIVITGRFDDKLAYIRSITLGYKEADMANMGRIGMYVEGQTEDINQTEFATGAVVTLKAQAEPGASFVRWVDVDGVTTLSTSPEYEYGNDVPGDLTILAEFGPTLEITVKGLVGEAKNDNLGYIEVWDAPMEVYALKYGQNAAGSKTPILAGHAPAGATCYGIAGKFPEGYVAPTGMTVPENDALNYEGAVPMGKTLYVYAFSNFDDPERPYAALNGWPILVELIVANDNDDIQLDEDALNDERPGTSTEENYTYTQSVLEGNAELGYPALGTPYMYTYLAADGHYCYPLDDVVNGVVRITATFDTQGALSGIDNIEAVEAITGDTEVYTLQGVRVAADNLTPGFYIVRQGGKATKILVK